MKVKCPRFGHGFELLEARVNPSSFGVPWADAGHLTLSFVPDGTPTPGGPSKLFQTLNAVAPTPVWQREILRAYQSWLSTSDISVSLVADGGLALGSTGAVQGDARFGDIRIAAYPMNSDEKIADGSPFSWTGTTFSGELAFNSQKLYEIGTALPTAYDIYSVAVHEAGHSFGLAHSEAADSVMHEEYQDYTAPGASDVTALRRLYGTRSPDAFDATANGNNTFATAASIPANGLTQLLAHGDLTTAADVDYYKFTISALGSLVPVAVRLKASGVSLLNAKITVLNAAGSVIGTAVANDPQSNDLAIQFNAALLGGTYTVKVERANDTFAIGKYMLAVDRGLLTALAPLVNPLVTILDAGTNDLISNATALLSPDPSGQNNRFDYLFTGAIESGTDKDFFKVTLPAASTPVNLYAMVWAADSAALKPHLQVYNAAQQLVPAKILANDTGLVSVVVPNATPAAEYFFRVASQTPGGMGRYTLAADMNTAAPPVFTSQVQGTIAPSTYWLKTVTFDTAALREFALSAANFGASATGTLTFTLYNVTSRAILSLVLNPGQQTVTTTRMIPAGTYRIRVTSTANVSMAFDLSTLQVSDSVGTYASKTTQPPADGPQQPATTTKKPLPGNSSQADGVYTF